MSKEKSQPLSRLDSEKRHEPGRGRLSRTDKLRLLLGVLALISPSVACATADGVLEDLDSIAPISLTDEVKIQDTQERANKSQQAAATATAQAATQP